MEGKKNSKLVTKILIITLVVIGALSIAQILLISSHTRNIVGQSYEEECTELTKLYTKQLSEKITEYMSLLQTYTNADVVKTGDPAQIVAWLQSNADIRDPQFDYVAFVDREGNFDSDINTHTTVTERSYYLDIIKSGKDETMDDPVASKVSGKTIVHICKAARYNGNIIGFFTGIVSLETLQNIVRDIKIGTSGKGSLFAGNGDLIATSADDEELVVENFKDILAKSDFNKNVQQSLHSGSANGEWANFGGTKNYITYAHVANTPSWMFFFNIDETQVYHAANTVVSWTIGACVAVALALLFIIGFMIIKSLKPLHIVQTTIDGIASGNADLTKRIELKNMENNEIGGVVDGFNSFSEKLQEIIRTLKISKEGLVNTGKALNQSTTETTDSISSIIKTMDSLGEDISNQSQSVTQTAQAVNQIAGNIESLNQMVEMQASSVTQASSAVEQMIGNINSVDQSVNKMAVAFSDLEQKAVLGVKKQEDVNTLIKTIEAESKTLQEANSVISSIAEQTNLLAMNAAIEAAHAGEAGKGFSVVADEIRKLSETSSSQSRTIGEQLKKISATITHIVQASLDAGKAFTNVSSEINNTNSLVQEIKHAMSEQASGSQQISQALSNMNNSTSNVRVASEQIFEENKSILSEIKTLQNATNNMRNGMDEVTSETKQISATGKSLSNLSNEMAKSIDGIGSQIDQFKV